MLSALLERALNEIWYNIRSYELWKFKKQISRPFRVATDFTWLESENKEQYNGIDSRVWNLFFNIISLLLCSSLVLKIRRLFWNSTLKWFCKMFG